MSDEPIDLAERRPCRVSPSKARYADLNSGHAAALTATAAAGIQIGAYECPGCGGYHLAQKPEFLGANHPSMSALARTAASARRFAEPDEEDGWEALGLDAVAHVPVGDLIAALRLTGASVRVQIHRG